MLKTMSKFQGVFKMFMLGMLKTMKLSGRGLKIRQQIRQQIFSLNLHTFLRSYICQWKFPLALLGSDWMSIVPH